MSQVIAHNLDTTYQDSIELIQTKINDDINLQILYNDTSVIRTLDSSEKYFVGVIADQLSLRVLNYRLFSKKSFSNTSATPSSLFLKVIWLATFFTSSFAFPTATPKPTPSNISISL